jgi:hypothetical protein
MGDVFERPYRTKNTLVVSTYRAAINLPAVLLHSNMDNNQVDYHGRSRTSRRRLPMAEHSFYSAYRQLAEVTQSRVWDSCHNGHRLGQPVSISRYVDHLAEQVFQIWCPFVRMLTQCATSTDPLRCHRRPEKRMLGHGSCTFRSDKIIRIRCRRWNTPC